MINETILLGDKEYKVSVTITPIPEGYELFKVLEEVKKEIDKHQDNLGE